ncbi:MAG: ABC transporter permease [Lachnospiraceae bacterium]|nr:ABC transporter permease [Lachnospiraceae bacterium]
MGKYILKRLLMSILIVFLVSVFAFSLMHILPGDPVRISLGESATEEMIEEYHRRYNLDKPIVEQYVLWIRGVLQGDFGKSLLYSEDVTELLKQKIPVTVSIGLPVVIVSAVFGLLFGVITAVKRGGWIDQVITFIANVGIGSPQFWIAILLIYLFGMQLHWLPIQGYTAPSDGFGDYIRMAILPVACLSFRFIATITRQTRSNMLEVINQDYVRTARANGIVEKSVIYRHALKNALIPVITIIGLQVRIVVSGSVVIEKIFNIPGLGSLLMRAITERDYFIVQACVLVISLVTVGCNLIVDLLYGVVDPRVRNSWR